MPAPHSAVWTTSFWPALNPLGSGYIMIAATPIRTTNMLVMVLDSMRPLSAPRWICMMTQ